MEIIKHYINGQLIESETKQDVFNPATGEVIAKLSMGNPDIVNQAVSKAKTAFATWSEFSPLKRVRILFKYKHLLEEHRDEISALITREHGKVLSDAQGELQRGIEVLEFACGIPHLLKGEYSSQISTAVDCYSIHQPVGVCVGITPFNFPAMVPMWMFPIALACGNTFILKPSEKDPSATMKIAELLYKAGLPDGVLNVIHGDKTVVDGLLSHKDVAAVSFVGSTPIAKYIYETAANHGKRVQALGGAKNHCVVMPDADIDNTISGLMGAGFGSAGERCMAISVVVAVGNETADLLVKRLSAEIDKLKVAPGTTPHAEMGPVISKVHQQNIIKYINSGVDQGATIVKDGRNFSYKGHENGFFVGPTLFDNVKPNMTIYQEEIFGPVLSIVRVGSLKEAMALINSCRYANGTSIYTRDGASARQFAKNIEVGMVGVNVAIPVPMAFHSFGGWKLSLFGDTHVHGSEGVKFYTKLKTITTRWSESDYTETNQFFMPTLQ